jgi:hypothetical protein
LWLGQIEDAWAPLFAEIGERFSAVAVVATDKPGTEIDKSAERIGRLYPACKLHVQRKTTAQKLIVNMLLLLRGRHPRRAQ